MDKQVMDKESPRTENGPYILIPYMPQNGTDQHEALVSLYFRLKREELDKVVFHEYPDLSLLDFMNVFSNPKCLLQIYGLKDADGKLADLCGMSWLSDICECSGILTKAVGSFVFFKDYQKPAFTDNFCELTLDYWFETLGIDTLVGLTPELNRLSSIYIKRHGMKEICRIPQYTTYDGQVCAGIISCLTKEEYRAIKRS